MLGTLWLSPGTTEIADLDLQLAQRQLQAGQPLPEGVQLVPPRKQFSIDLGMRQREVMVGQRRLLLQTSIPLGFLVEPTPASLRRSLLRAGLMIFFLAVAGLLITKLVRQALRPFQSSTAAVALGHLGHRLPLLSDPDLDPLVTQFNQMIATLGETESNLQSVAIRLAAAREHKRRVLAMVSHDLRSSLTALVGTAPEGSQLQQQSLALVNRLNRLLEWVRIDAGQIQIHLQEFEVNEVLEAALPSQAKVRLWPESLLIRSDFHWLTRLLESMSVHCNILPPEVLVQVQTMEAEQHLEIVVAGVWTPPVGDQDVPAQLSLSEAHRVAERLGLQLQTQSELRLRVPLVVL